MLPVDIAEGIVLAVFILAALFALFWAIGAAFGNAIDLIHIDTWRKLFPRAEEPPSSARIAYQLSEETHKKFHREQSEDGCVHCTVEKIVKTGER
jgi:hypothetical protein